MRDEALIHFVRDAAISPGVYLAQRGHETPLFLSIAAARFDSLSPGRSAAGLCAAVPDLVSDLYPPPPHDWPRWGFFEWDMWFGRTNGTFLVDLKARAVTQFPIHRVSPRLVSECDLSRMPGGIIPFAARDRG